MPTDSSFRLEARNHDYDRYLCSLFIHNRLRDDVWVAIAFASELARIVAIASNPTVSAIRLKWWQEALAELQYDNDKDRVLGLWPSRESETHHASARSEATKQSQSGPPLLIALQGVFSRHTLPSGLIDQMISARMMEVEYPQGFDNIAMFERYINGTSGALHEWLGWMMAPETTQNQRGLIYESASIYAVVGLLRAVPYDAERGVVRWPIMQSPEAVGVEHWLKTIKQKQFNHKDEFNTLPKLHRKLHTLSQYYAKSLWNHRADITRMPRRLGSMPWRLMLG